MTAVSEQSTSTAPASGVTEAHTGDEQAVRALFQRLLDAWGRGDGRAYGEIFTPDAEYVAFDGSRTVGRTAIAESHQRLFDTWLRGTRLTGRIESLRFLRSDVAVVIATGGTVFPGETEPRPSRNSIQTLVAVRQDDGWQFTSFHNTRIIRRTPFQWVLYGLASKLFRR